jgi:hypothetical protein
MQPSIPTASRRAIRRSPDRHAAALAADSHRDDVREQIRHAIRAGTFRVAPWPGEPDRVRLIPRPDAAIDR